MLHISYFNHVFKRFKIVFTRGTISRRTWYPRVDSKKISVILLKDSDTLGKSGEIVETSRGYANYHLIPNGIAAYANWYNIDLYSKPSDDSTHSLKDLLSKKSKDTSALDFNPEYILFSGRFANYLVSFTLKTFHADNTKLITPISLYRVLDEFSRKFHIDLVPSQVSQITNLDDNTTLNPLDGTDYMSFTKTGTYDIVVDFPLNEHHENKLEFTLELMPVDYGKHDRATDDSDFRLPDQ